jgi:hypothetical protein
MANEEPVHVALMRIQVCVDALTESLRKAWREHPGDDDIVESGLFQAHYSFRYLADELGLLYELFGTSEGQLQKDFAESDEDLLSPPGAHEPWVEISQIKQVND